MTSSASVAAGRLPRALCAALLAALLLALLAVLNGWIALPETARRHAGAALTVVAYACFCAGVYLRRRAQGAAMGRAGGGRGAGGPAILVAYASQTGFAEQIAAQTADVLRAAGMAVRLEPMGRVDAAALRAAGRALFVASTTGEGDPPDAAAGFARRVLAAPADLAGLEYGVLALGDSSYSRYCAFGRALDAWLRLHGARPLFDAVEVDDGDPGALRHWQHYLGVLSGSTDMADWSAPAYATWRLVERRLLNPGSPGAPAYHLALRPLDGGADWQAGDIAEIGPRHPPAEVERWLAALGLAPSAAVSADRGLSTLAGALAGRALPCDEAGLAALRGKTAQEIAGALPALPHREYSIASLPADGRLELLVRQVRHDDGRLGLGSGWLTEHAPVGADIALRIRVNRSFHPPAPGRPLILIGNGTGLAGLRAHLRARAAAGAGRNWLLFGERTRAHDYFHRDEIEAWRRGGVLDRVDLAFSRDGGPLRYVQDCVAAAADDVRAWVAEGAAIYVCGGLQGMAAGVAQALEGILGAEALERMAEEGRYRRDVY
ncbi:sulfite reductase flavoprotein subunit alpha [Pigmentiphaga soli]|uniref:NADPH--hemoprotein reductase n=1 Tax=Pigmentiphaga soli TaxID=1007095 RepID=A0ABP8H664_9BURK